MNVLQQLFPITSSSREAYTETNTLVSGSEAAGAAAIFHTLVAETIDEGRMLIIIDGKQTIEEQSAIIDYLRRRMTGGRCAYLFNNLEDTDSIDVLSVLNSSEEIAQYLAFIMLLSGVKPEEKDNLVFYYNLILSVFKAECVPYKVRDILSQDPDTVARRLDRISDMSAEDKENARIFLEGMRSLYVRSMIAAARTYKDGVMGKALNGTSKYSRIIRNGNVFLISIPALGHSTPYTKEENMNRYKIMYTLGGLIPYMIQRTITVPVRIVIRHSDFFPEEVMKDILSLSADYDVNVVWFPEDIADYVEKNGIEIFKSIPHRAVFREEDQKSADFWEKQSGHDEKTDISTSFTPKRTVFGFGSYMNTGGFMPNPFRRGTVTYGMSKRDKPNCPAERFKRLRRGEVLCYSAENGRIIKRRIILE